ncbi:MAG TPA: hypothetical protein VF511_01260, partial [Chthoniobacterales bacterium]
MSEPADRRTSGKGPAAIAASLAGVIGCIALIGWSFRIERFKALIPGLPVMNPATAICLMGAATGLLLLLPREAAGTRRNLGRFLAAVVLAIGLAKVLLLAFGQDVFIDRWLFPDSINEGRIPSRIPVRTAISFVLCGGALLLLNIRTRRGLRPAEILSTLVAIIALLALIGYAYGLIAMYRTETYEPMSLPGAIAFSLLAAGILLARTDAGAMRIIMSDTTGGLVSRLLLPVAFLLPILFGALRVAGENAGWYSTRLGVALFTTAFIIFFFVA